MKVLVADDSLVMRRLLQATLEGWGFEVVCVNDGAQAWEALLQPNAPRIAILDWIMPVHTGPEVCEMVRKQRTGEYIYLILLTSKSQREDIVEGMGAGADDYVVKPFEKSELEVRLRAGRRIVDLQEELMRAQEALREQAMRDWLTNCWNRRAIVETLEREVERAVREGRPLSLLMLDLDHFKQINDSRGHVAGDDALREVVRRIGTCMRSYDALGRYGGEEFMVVLPGCDEVCAISHAERLRRVIADEPMLLDGKGGRVTASFGASTGTPDQSYNVDHLIRAADEALYEAKRSGRNRVVFQAPDPVAAVKRSL